MALEKLAQLGGEPSFKYESERETRFGSMSFVVRVSNLVTRVLEMDLPDLGTGS